MKKSYKRISFIIGAIVVLSLPIFKLNANSSNPPDGRTGSPSDGTNCSACHSSFTAQSVNDVITTNIPSSGYVPGQTYTITAAGIEETGITKYGFQITAEDELGSSVGSFTAGSGSAVSSNYIEHSGAFSGATPSWTFSWTAPIAGTGRITLYGAFVLADQQGGNQGDQVKISSLSINEDQTTSIKKITEASFDIFISKNQLNIFNLSTSSIKNISVFNEIGQVVLLDSKQFESNLSIDINKFTSGIYFVNIQTNNGDIISKKVIK